MREIVGWAMVILGIVLIVLDVVTGKRDADAEAQTTGIPPGLLPVIGKIGGLTAAGLLLIVIGLEVAGINVWQGTSEEAGD